MVAGYHHHPYACGIAFSDRNYRLLPGRIYHSLKSCEGKVGHVTHVQRFFLASDDLVSHAEHPQGVFRHLIRFVGYLRSVQRFNFSIHELIFAHFQNAFGGALHIDDVFIFALVQGGHVLLFGLEGYLVEPHRFFADSAFGCRDD